MQGTRRGGRVFSRRRVLSSGRHSDFGARARIVFKFKKKGERSRVCMKEKWKQGGKQKRKRKFQEDCWGRRDGIFQSYEKLPSDLTILGTMVLYHKTNPLIARPFSVSRNICVDLLPQRPERSVDSCSFFVFWSPG
jgi:hypothetical protein